MSFLKPPNDASVDDKCISSGLKFSWSFEINLEAKIEKERVVALLHCPAVPKLPCLGLIDMGIYIVVWSNVLLFIQIVFGAETAMIHSGQQTLTTESFQALGFSRNTNATPTQNNNPKADQNN